VTPPSLGLLPDTAIDLDAPVVASLAAAEAQGLDFVLGRHEGALSLWQVGSRSRPLCIDFDAGKLGYRLAQGRARQETLVRAALGSRSLEGATLLDATAGLGRDAALLAASGFTVTMLERNPLLAALLADALVRARNLPWHTRLALVPTDACDYLADCDAFDVIYLDPMFAAHDSRAQVKKELVWLRQLLGQGEATEEERLLTLARRKARRRVVVKRAAKAPVLAGVVPTASLDGKAVRFDIYTPL
jgi:16S rRNA (guanine1516-N2)-methyltransferase